MTTLGVSEAESHSFSSLTCFWLHGRGAEGIQAPCSPVASEGVLENLHVAPAGLTLAHCGWGNEKGTGGK